MKIAIVCYPTFGGSGVIATEMGLSLASKGIEVHFITYKHPVRLDVLSSKVYFHEVHVPEYPLFHFQPYELALSSKLVDTVQKFKIDLLHVHYAIPHAYAAYMAKKMLAEKGIKIPLVTTLHGTDITLVGSHPFYKSAVTFSINNSDYVTSVSKSLKKQTINFFNINKEISVIPNFVDFSRHQDHSESCDRSSIAPDNFKILTHVSNFRPVKRVLDVVKVFEKVFQKTPSKLIMVGDGPDKIIAENYCLNKEIQDHVIFLGNTSDVYEVLCYSDLFLLTSETESFGLAALEAMMMSVPVISTNTGGLPEVNIENESGFLFKVGDIEGMSRKSIELLASSKLLNQMKASARNTALKFYIDNVIDSYLEIYKKAINRIN
ncbi:MAG: N-acetyl-alpha-D-glucosaminyl L-malate synthase BshA [Flavobacteriaceae bacterium]